MTSPDRSAIVDEAHRIEEDAEHTAVVQFLAAQRNRAAHFLLGVPAAVLAAAAGVIALSDGDLAVAGVLALGSTLLTSIQTFVGPDKRAAAQHALGTEYRALQSEARVFRTIQIDDLESDRQVRRITELTARRSELNRQGSALPERLFKKAQAKVREGDTRHEVDVVRREP